MSNEPAGLNLSLDDLVKKRNHRDPKNRRSDGRDARRPRRNDMGRSEGGGMGGRLGGRDRGFQNQRDGYEREGLPRRHGGVSSGLIGTAASNLKERLGPIGNVKERLGGRSEDHDYNGEEQWEVTRVRGAGGPYRAPPSGAYQHNDWGAAEYQPGPRDIRDWIQGAGGSWRGVHARARPGGGGYGGRGRGGPPNGHWEGGYEGFQGPLIPKGGARGDGGEGDVYVSLGPGRGRGRDGSGRGAAPAAKKVSKTPEQIEAEERLAENISQEETGDVVVTQMEDLVIVRVKPTGEIVLSTGGDMGDDMLATMSAALNVLGLKVTASKSDSTQWTVSDGKSLLRRFTEDMVIPPAAGQAGKGRALTLLQAGKNAAALDATAASNAAAAAAGISAGGRGNGRGRGRSNTYRYTPY